MNKYWMNVFQIFERINIEQIFIYVTLTKNEWIYSQGNSCRKSNFIFDVKFIITSN